MSAWVLVLVGIMNGSAESRIESVHEDMFQCFAAREQIIYEYFGSENNHPPTNYQVVCIPSDKY